MKLSEFFAGGIMHKRAKLLVDISLDNGECLPSGATGYVLKDYGDGTFHFEQNDFACRVKKTEIEFIK